MAIGGCHRVIKVDGMFTEHAPRIYSTAYINTTMMLKNMGHKFTDLFVPYNFSIATVGGQSIQNMHISDLFWFTQAFIKLLFNSEYGKTISMDEFMISHNFTQNTQDYVNRMCRLTDGAGSDKYTLFEFLQLLNQQLLYKIYQPNRPNDEGLFKIYESVLLKTGNVDIMLNTDVTSLNVKDNKIMSITVDTNGTTQQIMGDKVMLAIPPIQLTQLLNGLNAFGDYDNLKTWAVQTEYIDDIGIVYHWKDELKLPRIWGFPASRWGVAFIVLTDYMQIPNSKTCISTCITITNVKSAITGKLPGECTQQELIDEVFLQLQDGYPQLSRYDIAIVNPHVYKNGDDWDNRDSAFVETNINKFIEAKSAAVNNLYTVGTHNGKSLYHFTSYESAVTNALDVVHKLIPESIGEFPINKPTSLIDIIRLIFIIGLLVVIYKYQHRVDGMYNGVVWLSVIVVLILYNLSL